MVMILLLIAIALPSTVFGMTGRFWHITDFHYDPTYNTGDGRVAMSCDEGMSGPLGQYGDYSCDSPWLLIQDSIENMARIDKNVDFILWTGDSVAHMDEESKSLDINVGIISNITAELKRTFPTIPVYASLGNHDFNPKDRANGSEREMYSRIAAIWEDWIDDPEQLKLCQKGGYYSKLVNPGFRVIVLNTVLYYQVGNAATMQRTSVDPAGQLAWLRRILTASRDAQEKVIITAHISPMLGALSLLEWFHPMYGGQYRQIMYDFADVILAHHYGHDHFDTFRILQKEDGSGSSAVYIAPSVTTTTHNPTFRLVEYDKATGQHLNYHQYYLNLTESNEKSKTHWTELYNFQDTYGVPDMSVGSLRRIYSNLTDPDGKDMMNYCKYQNVSTVALPTYCSLRNKGILWCSGQMVDLAETKVCIDKYISDGNKNSASIVRYDTVNIAVMTVVVLFCFATMSFL